MLAMRPTLVTGGAGFLGSHLCARLLADGHQVIAVDDFSTGQPANLAPIAGHPDLRVVRHDVVEPRDFDVGRIYNLACPASPVQYQRDPVRTTQTSVLGALNALQLGLRRGARVLQASTSEVYGDPQVHPQPETYWGHVDPTGPRACYDEGKRVAETLFADHHRAHGLDIRIVRIFNTYGPHMARADGRVVSNFVVRALAEEPLVLYGGGTQTRSFCYVGDLVEGLVQAMERDVGPQPINLGNPDEHTIRALAERIRRLTGSASPLVDGPLPAHDPVRRRPDVTRARELLGWRPQVDLDEGLRRTIAWFRQAP